MGNLIPIVIESMICDKSQKSSVGSIEHYDNQSKLSFVDSNKKSGFSMKSAGKGGVEPDTFNTLLKQVNTVRNSKLHLDSIMKQPTKTSETPRLSVQMKKSQYLTVRAPSSN